jgi:hypothetical protein
MWELKDYRLCLFSEIIVLQKLFYTIMNNENLGENVRTEEHRYFIVQNIWSRFHHLLAV